MPWKETSVQDQRVQFIGMYLTGEYNVSELCRAFDISRTIGHKLINAYNEGGLPALERASRAPLNHPNATPAEIEARIREFKGRHDNWGPKKIRVGLLKECPDTAWPATSTIGEILKRGGLTKTRKRVNRSGLIQPTNPMDASGSNATWCADFKGQFTLGNSQWCYPLTITDAHARMLLRCQCLENTSTLGVRPIFTAAFREYGLPEAIRTDNGTPFASTGLGGLTTLSVWWIKLGIRLDRIQRGHPEQNGRHERMHREMKAQVAMPSAYDMNAQQRACDRFRDEYNNIRPHEGIGMATPASLYVPSQRKYPAALPEIEYPEGMIIRKVRNNGYMRWKGGLVYLSEALIDEPVGLDQLDDRHLAIYYATMPLAILDGSGGKLLPRKEAVVKLEQLRKESDP